MKKLVAVVRECVKQIENGDPGDSSLDEACSRLVAAGIAPNIHVGRYDLEGKEVVEWYAGQILDIIQNRRWFAVNSMLNCLDKFVPAAEVNG